MFFTKSSRHECLLAFAALLTVLPISGGEKYGLRDDQYPSVVHVEISGDPRNVPGCCPRCSGVLISLKHVVTVATCLWSVQDTQPKPNDIQVYAGTSEVSGKIFNENAPQWGYGACSRSVQRVQAVDVIYHKRFHPQFFSLHQDVALIVIPKLEPNRFVQPIEMSFDTFDGSSAKMCKIVGFGILKFPRAGYFNLLTWLQPMTRWERDVTVKNGCMGKPSDWNKKKWGVMTQGSLCSTVYSSESRVCWNDRGAALVCNGFLAGMVQAQYEDDGKLDLTLRQCSDMDVAGPGKGGSKRDRYQIIFFNMKYIAELIPEQMARTKDLQWTRNYSFNRTEPALDLNITEPVQNLSSTTEVVTVPTTTTPDPQQWPPRSKPINFHAERKAKRPVADSRVLKKATITERPTTVASSLELRNATISEKVDRPRKRRSTTPAVTTQNASLHTMRYEEFNDLPELEMDFLTEEQDYELSNVSVDDIFNDNNPFNKSCTNVHHLAIILNLHSQHACTGVFITPQSVLTGASCLVRQEENYQHVGVDNYRIVTGHSNGLVDFCSDKINMWSVQNVTILDRGLRQDWQLYQKSRILPFTEIYNLAVVTIVGSHLSNSSYAPIDYDTWTIPPPKPESPLSGDSGQGSNDLASPALPGSESDGNTLRCKMFGYGHLNYPYTNQKDRIGIKSIDLEISENCSRPFFDYPYGEKPQNLWQGLESPHFFCAVNLSPTLGPSMGSIGAPLYCGPNLVGLYVGRYNNHSFDSLPGPLDPNQSPSLTYTHVFLKLDHYNDWITDVLLDEAVVQMRLARLPTSSAPSTSLTVLTLCVLLSVPRILFRC